jgi:hypothetical protein
MSKIMYLAERKPGFSDEGFVARWRQHGALAMSLPMGKDFKRYIQASVLRPAPAPGASDAYDAVGVLWMHEGGHLKAPTPQHVKDVETLAVDELETFAYPIAPVCMAVDETVLKAGEAPVTAYAFFNDAAKARRFAEGAAESRATRRVALNVKAAAPGIELKLPYEAIVEVSADQPPALADLNLAAADLAVVARDAVLFPRPA